MQSNWAAAGGKRHRVYEIDQKKPFRRNLKARSKRSNQLASDALVQEGARCD
jgi:hypothetical protein